MNILKKSKIKEYRDKEKDKEGGVCPLLDIELDSCTVSRACLDHSHDIPRKGWANKGCGRVRGVLSNTGNLLLGRLEKIWNKYGNKNTHLTFSDFLRNAADYLERDFSDTPLHYIEVDKWKKRLKKWRVRTILDRLEKEGIDTSGVKLKKDVINLYVEKVILPMYFEED